MKSLKLAALFFVLLFAVKAMAQEGMEDVVYLKNGNIYRGIIIEQVPGQTMKVQTIGGNVFTVEIAEIAKITKENKIATVNNYPPAIQPYGQYEPYLNRHSHNGFQRMDSASCMRHEFHYKRRGYFMQAYLIVEAVQGGGRMIHGYKFGRLGYLGIGFGVDLIVASPLHGNIDNMPKDFFKGTYLPLFLYYSGDITKKNITPFYALEAGYAWAAHGSNMDMGSFGSNGNSHTKGGMMGSIGLGVKFNARKRVNFKISAALDFKSFNYTQIYAYYDANGNYIQGSDRKMATLLFPGLKFGIGF